MNLQYILRLVREASFQKMAACIEDVHLRSGKQKPVIFLDMVGCMLKYGAGYYDYSIFEFYHMKAAQRRTYMTRTKNKRLLEQMNDSAYLELFERKNLFYERFSEFLGREVLDLSKASREDVLRFIQGKNALVAKPSVGECGKGIELLRPEDFDDSDALYAYLTNPGKGFGVLEERIIQHPEMSRLYPDSVNCFRMVTLVQEGTAHLLYAVLKTGNHGNFVDNLESGGFACHFDLERGVVTGPGHTSKLERAEVHPATGVRFEGFAPPYAHEAAEMVKRAALVVPQVRYVGWDVCIMEHGPAIIEGNVFPAYDFPQLPDENRPRVGFLKQLEDLGVKL